MVWPYLQGTNNPWQKTVLRHKFFFFFFISFLSLLSCLRQCSDKQLIQRFSHTSELNRLEVNLLKRFKCDKSNQDRNVTLVVLVIAPGTVNGIFQKSNVLSSVASALFSPLSIVVPSNSTMQTSKQIQGGSIFL